ncbi:MAG: hypothetical protein CL405_06690 [Acidimicrobiaceae bacterium]|nr:hypothetical protein [Acidimicrobiaceae bacterium]
MRRLRVPIAVLVFWAVGGAACGSPEVTDSADATDCVELVEAGRAVAERVLERLSGQTLLELEAANPGDPFAAIEPLMRTSELDQRADELGCHPEELRVQACEIYGGLAYRARGEVASDFLAPYLESCD